MESKGPRCFFFLGGSDGHQTHGENLRIHHPSSAWPAASNLQGRHSARDFCGVTQRPGSPESLRFMLPEKINISPLKTLTLSLNIAIFNRNMIRDNHHFYQEIHLQMLGFLLSVFRGVTELVATKKSYPVSMPTKYPRLWTWSPPSSNPENTWFLKNPSIRPIVFLVGRWHCPFPWNEAWLGSPKHPNNSTKNT